MVPFAAVSHASRVHFGGFGRIADSLIRMEAADQREARCVRFLGPPPIRLRSGQALRGGDGAMGVALMALSKSAGRKKAPLYY